MSTYLKTIAPDLALGAIASSITCYGVNQIFPSSNNTFLVVSGAIHTCTFIILRNLVDQVALRLTKNNGYLDEEANKITNNKFFSLGQCFCIGMDRLLIVFYRSIAQKMGVQTPSFLHTVGCISLASSAYWGAKFAIQFIQESSKPSRNQSKRANV